MNRYFYVLVLMIFTTSVCNSQTIIRTEILGKPRDTGMSLKLFFSTPAEMAVQYGTTSGNYSMQSNWQTFAANEPACKSKCL